MDTLQEVLSVKFFVINVVIAVVVSIFANLLTNQVGKLLNIRTAFGLGAFRILMIAAYFGMALGGIGLLIDGKGAKLLTLLGLTLVTLGGGFAMLLTPHLDGWGDRFRNRTLRWVARLYLYACGVFVIAIFGTIIIRAI